MLIDRELLRKVAKNARLRLTDEELTEFTPQLKEILDVFSQLDKVNTDNTLMSIQPVDLKNVLREDVQTPCLSQDRVLANTIHKKNGYFLGPKAL